jgi:hypothetical protein
MAGRGVRGTSVAHDKCMLVSIELNNVSPLLTPAGMGRGGWVEFLMP